MKIEVQVKEVGSTRTWTETYIIDKDPETYIEETFDKFNGSLRLGELPREVLNFSIVDKDLLEHKWVKTNLATLKNNIGFYDAMQCTQCGITGKRYGLGTLGTRRDSKYKARKYDYCKT